MREYRMMNALAVVLFFSAGPFICWTFYQYISGRYRESERLHTEKVLKLCREHGVREKYYGKRSFWIAFNDGSVMSVTAKEYGKLEAGKKCR